MLKEIPNVAQWSHNWEVPGLNQFDALVACGNA